MSLPLIFFLVFISLVIAVAVLVFLFIRRMSLHTKLGDYNLLEIIGRGGMATIYRAKNRVLKRIVAVKIMDQGLVGDADLVYKFLKEGENLAKINSEFPDSPVVKAIEYSHPQSDSLFIAMDYLEGANLKEIINSGNNLDLESKLHIIREVARGLHCSHSLQIYHRDVSPGNIIVHGDTITLIDFGIAKQEFSSYHTLQGGIVGKPYYMSPEQCGAKPVSEKSDIYSLGAVLFYLLEGKPIYDSRSHIEILKMHQTSPIPAITEPVTEELKDLINKMVAKKPQDRPAALKVAEKLDILIEQGI
jgi:serine/threonine protein kinase